MQTIGMCLRSQNAKLKVLQFDAPKPATRGGRPGTCPTFETFKITLQQPVCHQHPKNSATTNYNYFDPQLVAAMDATDLKFFPQSQATGGNGKSKGAAAKVCKCST